MQTLKKFYFGKSKVKVPNTFIGGIGGTINTSALLAAKLGIPENIIRLFKVTGVDVECVILGENTILRTSFHNDSNVTFFINTDGITTISGQNASQSTFYNCQSLEIVSIHKCTDLVYIPDGPPLIFRFCPKLKHVYLPNLLRSGLNPTRDTFNFQEMQSTPKIYVNPFMSTSNTGAEEGDIAYARSQGASIRYVNNFTPPNTINNLSLGTIYNTAVQLNFTPPTSVNGIDFYEVYLNGEKFNSKEIKNSGEFITGLTPSTNYNIRIVAVDMFYNKSELSNTVNVSTTNRVATDADAISYINASANTIFQDIIDDMFVGLKTQGLYTKIQAFYPFLGTTSAQHKWNAKNPLDTNAAFRLQFFGGGTHSNLGYQCNGTNAYANTFFVPSVQQNLNSNGLTVTVGTNNTKALFSVEIGAENSNTQSSLIYTRLQDSNTSVGCDLNTQSTRINISNYNNSKGIFTGTKTVSNVHKLIRNGNVLGTGVGGGSLPTIPFWIGKYNSSIVPTQGFSNQRIQFTAIHEGLTDTEVATLHTIIDTFETAIGRKTW